MRLFFALALDDPTRAAVAAVVERIQRQLGRARASRAVKWVERENLHVTLRFIGEVAEDRATTLIAAVRPALEVAPFRIGVGNAGSFPRTGLPRVLWVGVGEGSDETRGVFAALDRRLDPLGFVKEDRAYTPHLTLGRVREIDRAAVRLLRDALDAVPPLLSVMDVSRVTLYRSQLSPKGPRYEVVAETPLS